MTSLYDADGVLLGDYSRAYRDDYIVNVAIAYSERHPEATKRQVMRQARLRWRRKVLSERDNIRPVCKASQ